jgi:hypothetical protein
VTEKEVSERKLRSVLPELFLLSTPTSRAFDQGGGKRRGEGMSVSAVGLLRIILLIVNAAIFAGLAYLFPVMIFSALNFF